MAQPVEILLMLVASNLILKRINLLLALQAIDLLLLAQRISFALDAANLLVGLQPLELLIVAFLIELDLSLSGLRVLRLKGIGPPILEIVQLLLRLPAFLTALEILQLLVADCSFRPFLLARFGLFLDKFFTLRRRLAGWRNKPTEREHSTERNHPHAAKAIHKELLLNKA